MLDLKNKLNIILDHIDDKEDVIFLDFPMYYNVGDILIFKGTELFFKENNIKVRKSFSDINITVRKLKKYVNKNTTIIFQGGGNFGDIYNIHQSLREDIVSNFKNKIIVLPQTAYFDSEDNLCKSRNKFKSHDNIVLFARDEHTYKLFKSFSKNTYLCPDMAHYLYGNLPKSQFKTTENFYFLRKDVEMNLVQDKFVFENKIKEIYDWVDLIGYKDRKILSLLRWILNINKFFNINFIDFLVYKIWSKYCDLMISKFSLLFSSKGVIITSRLHGHILTCLVDSQSILFDNSYGKNSSYYYCWTKELINTSIKN